jgi:RimJ/RimL family protein N-acetyltransferase
MIRMRPNLHGMRFGYMLARQHWNNGLVSEALRCLVDWSLRQVGVFRAWAFCDMENRSSAHVMEKVGMSFEGVLRKYALHPNIAEEPRDCLLYSKVTGLPNQLIAVNHV